MKGKFETIIITAFFLFMAIIASSSPISAVDTITIVGEVNDANQIVADNLIYEVDDTPEGNDLTTNYISEKVEVTGRLRIEGDMRIIAVKSFKIVKE
jgi:hypothetical protein